MKIRLRYEARLQNKKSLQRFSNHYLANEYNTKKVRAHKDNKTEGDQKQREVTTEGNGEFIGLIYLIR